MILAIGILHDVVGVLFGVGWLPPLGPPAELNREAPMTPLLDIVRDGVVGAVEPHMPRMVFFWFVTTGFALMLLGGLAREMERRGPGLTRGFALALAAFSLGGVLMIPASGFWLGFVPALVAWRRSGALSARA